MMTYFSQAAVISMIQTSLLYQSKQTQNRLGFVQRAQVYSLHSETVQLNTALNSVNWL